MGDQPSDEDFAPQARKMIVVMGVSGSGKSTLGRLLADRLQCPFIEGDELHLPSSIQKMRNGIPLADEDRWPWLDRLGDALRAATQGSDTVVAACSALKFSYRERLVAAAGEAIAFILLETDREELSRRVDSRKDHYMPASLLASQLAALERPHDGERALILDASQPPEALCEASRTWIDQLT